MWESCGIPRNAHPNMPESRDLATYKTSTACREDPTGGDWFGWPMRRRAQMRTTFAA
jgi:hypothetical protein